MSDFDKLIRQRDVIASEIEETREHLLVLINNGDRRSKVKRDLKKIEILENSITEKTQKLINLSSSSSTEHNFQRWLDDFSNDTQSFKEKAEQYISSLPPGDVMSVSTKSSSKSLRLSLLNLKEQQIREETQRRLDIELQLKRLEIEESSRGKLQEVENERQLVELESDLSSVVNDDQSVIDTHGVDVWVNKQQKFVSNENVIVPSINTISCVPVSDKVVVTPSSSSSFVRNSFLVSQPTVTFQNTACVMSRDYQQGEFSENISQNRCNKPVNSNFKSLSFSHFPSDPNRGSDPLRSSGQPDFSSTNRTSHTFAKTLPKLTIPSFGGNILEYPEFKGLFMSVIDKSDLSNDEKLAHLKGLLRGEAKVAVQMYGVDGAFYHMAWKTLDDRFGKAHIIVSTQLSKLQSHPPVRIHNSEAVVEYALIVQSFVSVLTQFNYINDLYAASNMHLALSKLPPNLKEDWCKNVTLSNDDNPSLLTFNDWLQNIADTHRRLIASRTIDSKKVNKAFKSSTVLVTSAKSQQSTNDKSIKCQHCGDDHRVVSCPDFRNRTPSERAIIARDKSLCFSCLFGGHSAKKCKYAKSCGIDNCTKKHNKLLHGAERVFPARTTSTSNNVVTRSFYVPTKKGLLQIVQIQLHNNDKHEKVLALCDTGSDFSWIAADVADRLSITGTSTNMTLEGFIGSVQIDTQHVKISISGSEDEYFDANAYVRHFSLSSEILDVKILKQKYSHLDVVPLDTYNLANVKMLIGMDNYHLIRPLEYRSVRDQEPWAVRLPLGWVLSGPLPQLQREVTHRAYFASAVNSSQFDDDTQNLSDQVRQWWSLETYSANKNVDPRSKEDKRAITLLENTTTHDGSRYSIGLLWAKENLILPNNYWVAEKQLLALESRLAKDPELKSRYAETITIDLNKGYVRKVFDEEIESSNNKNQWFLPHHPVINPNKPGKVRRVCNAASKFRGTSLNNELLTGPDLLNNLVAILLRFRRFKVAFAADIEAMFLQIGVTDDDQRALRFLWREDSSNKIEIYQYTRHIFGAKDSPCCANYAVKRTAADNKTLFPVAADIAKNNFYMDDLLHTVKTNEEAIQLSLDLVKLMKLGGFNLTKWICNSEEVINCIEKEGIQTSQPKSLHVLGVEWDLKSDTVVINRGSNKVKECSTQREVLSAVSSVFDPIGVLAPFTIRARLILKEIWKRIGQNWDEPLCQDIHRSVVEWLNELKTVNTIKIQRQYFFAAMDDLELHVFTDASLDAMCVVIYLRNNNFDGTGNLSFVMGKSRVAPIKSLSIPKLELQASLIGCRMAKMILAEIDLPISRTIFWSDNSTTVQWIKGHNKKQEVFVANRVAEILESTTVDQWRHVPGELNPADLGTRGLSANELSSSIWLKGPPFLLEIESQWPKMEFQQSEVHTMTLLATTTPTDLIDFDKFSSFNKYVRIVAYCLRVRYKTHTTYISVQEMTRAKLALWHLVQRQTFFNEIAALSKDKILPFKSKLIPLSPFIDDDGILRAKGRLRKASFLSFDQKHPIVLDAKHPLVTKFLEKIHRENFHEGNEYLRALIQSEYWILKLRSMLRALKYHCLSCKKLRSKNFEPEMADLPLERLDSCTYPFTNTGLDYFGPFNVTLCRKTMKRWCCLFTCLTTRAIHIEICDTLSTDSCINAIERFVAIRGKPRVLISDNGTNFVGASNELKACLAELERSNIAERLASFNIKWKFNPPSAPHFGGVWERLVRSCKKAMYHILGSQKLTDDVLKTVVCMVIQTLNARPLTPASSDVEDLEAITPYHFLIGRRGPEIPMFWTECTNVNHRKSFKQAQAFSKMIWERWHHEYVPKLLQRHTKQHEFRNIKVGDLVWLKEPSNPVGQFPLGRILKVHPGDDGVIRSALIKTQLGTFHRPLVKLIPLFS